MEGNHCRLFDENLVRNIMISTGLTMYEYMREHGSMLESEVKDFVETNADSIIWNTIEDMNIPKTGQDISAEDDELDEMDGLLPDA